MAHVTEIPIPDDNMDCSIYDIWTNEGSKATEYNVVSHEIQRVHDDEGRISQNVDGIALHDMYKGNDNE